MLEVAVDLESGTPVGMVFVKPARLHLPQRCASVPSSPLLLVGSTGYSKLHFSLSHAKDVTVILQ